MSTQVTLTDEQRAAILELGSKGSGGRFDHFVMSQLFTLNLVDVRSEDRRLVLTDSGRQVYQRVAQEPSE